MNEVVEIIKSEITRQLEKEASEQQARRGSAHSDDSDEGPLFFYYVSYDSPGVLNLETLHTTRVVNLGHAASENLSIVSIPIFEALFPNKEAEAAAIHDSSSLRDYLLRGLGHLLERGVGPQGVSRMMSTLVAPYCRAFPSCHFYARIFGKYIVICAYGKNINDTRHFLRCWQKHAGDGFMSAVKK